MQPATYAAGVRRPFESLPSAVHQWVEAQLGASVDQISNKAGGFSPGAAAVVSSRRGEALFVKAVGSHVNSDAVRFCRAERDACLRIPVTAGILLPVAWADLEVDGESYAVLAFPALDGVTPRHPWRSDELRATLDALQRTSHQLTPSPWPAEPADHRLIDFFRGWDQISANSDDPWRQDPWVRPRLAALTTQEQQLRTELPGETLSHSDLRADNIVITRERIWFVDWAHAQNAGAWVDAALLMADVVASCADRADGGEIDIAATIRAHSSLGTARFDSTWRTVISLAGALHAMSRLPSPPGLPTIRGWQSRSADALLSWCRRESPIG